MQMMNQSMVVHLWRSTEFFKTACLQQLARYLCSLSRLRLPSSVPPATHAWLEAAVSTLVQVHMQHPQPQDMITLASCAVALSTLDTESGRIVGATLIFAAGQTAQGLMAGGSDEFGSVLWAAAYALQRGSILFKDSFQPAFACQLCGHHLQSLRTCCIRLTLTPEGSVQLLSALLCLLDAEAAALGRKLPAVQVQVTDMIWKVVLTWTPPPLTSSASLQAASAAASALVLDAADLLLAVGNTPGRMQELKSSGVLARMLAALRHVSGDVDGPRRQVLNRVYRTLLA
jgi:hypothetical protein